MVFLTQFSYIWGFYSSSGREGRKGHGASVETAESEKVLDTVTLSMYFSFNYFFFCAFNFFYILQLCVLFLLVNNCFSWPERISHVNVCCCYCGFVLQRDNDSRRLRDSKADELTAWSLIDITVLPDNVFSYIFDNFKAFGSEIYHPISTSFGLTENYISFSERLNREIPIQFFVALLNKIFQN